MSKTRPPLLKSPTGRPAIICVSGVLVTSSNQDNTAMPYQTFNLSMSLSPSNFPSPLSESESDNDFEIEEHAVHQVVHFLRHDVVLRLLATEEEAVTNRGMPVRNEGLYYQSCTEKISKCVLEGHEFHGTAAPSLISLKHNEEIL